MSGGGLGPEGGGVVEQEAEQLGAITVGIRPHGVQGADRQQSSSTSVSGSCRDSSGVFTVNAAFTGDTNSGNHRYKQVHDRDGES